MILCIMGKSSSGKDTIYKKLINDKLLELLPIVTYTTRPIRIGETNGVEYYFVDDNQLSKFKAEGKIIEIRQYNTAQGIWKYATIDDGSIEVNKKNYAIITTLEAYNNIRNYFGVQNVLPIYIEVEDGLRLQRALERERLQTNPRYNEMCRRFLADADDFSEQHIKESQIQHRFINDNLEHTYNEIITYIRDMGR